MPRLSSTSARARTPLAEMLDRTTDAGKNSPPFFGRLYPFLDTTERMPTSMHDRLVMGFSRVMTEYIKNATIRETRKLLFNIKINFSNLFLYLVTYTMYQEKKTYLHSLTNFIAFPLTEVVSLIILEKR